MQNLQIEQNQKREKTDNNTPGTESVAAAKETTPVY